VFVLIQYVVDVVVVAHAPSPKDSPDMTIPMIKSNFGFVVVSYLFLSSIIC